MTGVLAQMFAVVGVNEILGKTLTVTTWLSDCGAVQELSTAKKSIVFATPIIDAAAVKQKLPEAGL